MFISERNLKNAAEFTIIGLETAGFHNHNFIHNHLKLLSGNLLTYLLVS